MINILGNPSGKKLRIGSYQGPIIENDVDANLSKVRDIIQEHAHLNLDFLCFPETYLSGYKPESIVQSAMTLSDNRLLEFITWSGQYDTVFLVGMSEKTEDGIYNTELVIYRGKLIGKQNKTMLTQGYDNLHFASSLELNIFEAKGIKFGIAICHTTSFVEPALYLRLKGARLLFTPHFNDITPEFKTPNCVFTSSAHRDMVLNNQVGLAALLKMVVVRSNIITASSNALGWGDSNIWDMDGKLAAEGEPFREMVVWTEFPMEIFTAEGVIDRREVPLKLYEMIYEAAKQFFNENKG